MLKFNADRLPREYRAKLSTVLVALGSVVVVLVGNVVQQ